MIAGIDQVAVDLFGATLFGLKGNQLGYIVAGHKAGLGNMDLGKAKIRKIKILDPLLDRYFMRLWCGGRTNNL